MLVLRASLTARRPARRAPGSARLARRRRSPCPPRVRLARRVACAPACACVPPLAAAPTPLPSRPAGTEQSDPPPIAQGGASRAEGPGAPSKGGTRSKRGDGTTGSEAPPLKLGTGPAPWWAHGSGGTWARAVASLGLMRRPWARGLGGGASDAKARGGQEGGRGREAGRREWSLPGGVASQSGGVGRALRRRLKAAP